MKWFLLTLVVLSLCSQCFAGKKKLLKKIGINPKNCQASSVGNLNFMELLNAGCWRLKGGLCAFESPCKGKKNKKFNCKKNPGGFCKACNMCTCKGNQETCAVNIQSCQDQLQQSLNQGCFIGKKKNCQFVYPCPKECNDGDTKCDECNHCFCANGKWACTKKGCGSCPGDCWKKVGNTCKCNSICPGAKPTFTPCQSGDTACSECNGCSCTGNNNWICTLKGCLTNCPKPCWGPGVGGGCQCLAEIKCGTSRLPFGKCSYGDTTCQACNKCTCSEGGWACTEKACLQRCPSDCWVLKGNTCVCQDFCLNKQISVVSGAENELEITSDS